MNIGNKLKVLRIKNEYEPIIIAEKLGISISTYRRFERNLSYPDLKILEKISLIHEISLEELIKKDSPLICNKSSAENETITFLYNKLVEQYEKRLKDKDEIIKIKYNEEKLLKKHINKLVKELNQIKSS